MKTVMAASLTTSVDNQIKDSPAYTPILKLVLKSQIQFLVNQLAEHGEQCLLLTASVKDSSVSHLGCSTGLGFMKASNNLGHQFLRFCHQSKNPKLLQTSHSPNLSLVRNQMLMKRKKSNGRTKCSAVLKRPRITVETSADKTVIPSRSSETCPDSSASAETSGSSHGSKEARDVCGLDLQCDSVVHSGTGTSKYDYSSKENNIEIIANSASKTDQFFVKVEPDLDSEETENSLIHVDEDTGDPLATKQQDEQFGYIVLKSEPVTDGDLTAGREESPSGVQSSCHEDSQLASTEATEWVNDALANIPSDGNQAHRNRHIRKPYSIQTKYDALAEVEQGILSKVQIAKKYGIPPNTLSTWLKNAEKIKCYIENQKLNPSKKKLRNSVFVDVEQAVLDWLATMKSSETYLVQDEVMEKANEIARSLGYSEAEFRCSSGWVNRFKERYGFIKGFMQKSFNPD